MAPDPKSFVRETTGVGTARWGAVQRIIAELPSAPVAPALPQPVTAADLPSEAQAILGRVCAAGDCLEQQPLCPPDPRVTCQLVPADPASKAWVRDWVKLPWRIANAFKGDLLLTPGGGNGVISTLLSQLQPPQHYTHMGIFVRDHVEVRHATGSGEWLEANPNGHIILSGPQPSDGFQEDAVRYGWPGTVTQSVDVAYNAWRDDKYAPAFLTAPDGKPYVINALGFGPARVNVEPDDAQPPRWQTLRPLVVSPCPALETRALRAALHAVADEVRRIRGHYRFYAYTDAAIALDPNWEGPPTLEDFQPDPANPCGPPLRVQRTIPVVCSSVIWAAVQRLNNSGRLPRLVLDPGDAPPPENRPPCVSTLQREPRWDTPEPGRDGLYAYGEAERLGAAEALHAFLVDKVRRKIMESVPGIVSALGGAGIAVSVMMAAVNLPLAALAALLGISASEAATLVEWTSDMPDDVANQIVNAFASDDCAASATDSEAWRKPGSGRAVSPDNILRSWAAPQPTRSDGRERLVGLYGHNRAIVLRPPKWEVRPLTAWAVSAGPAAMSGVVRYRGRPVNGARVRVCCTEGMSARQQGPFDRGVEDGTYVLAPPAGSYLAVAAYEDPEAEGLVASAEVPVTLEFLNVARLDFDLQPPPEAERIVNVSGRMDIVSRVAFGKDWWGHPEFVCRPMQLGPYGPPGSPEPGLGTADWTGTSEQLSDYGSVRLKVTAEWQPDFSVKISFEAAIFDGDDQRVLAERKDQIVAKDTARSWTVDLATGGAWPDRAHVALTVSNDRQG